MKTIAIGTDIGGSHISCAAVDFQKQCILPKSFVAYRVNPQAPADEILTIWSRALGQSMAAVDGAKLAGIGFAMPGPFDYVHGIAQFTAAVAKYQNLRGIPVSQRLKERMALPAEFELRYINDATAFGVGEAWMGKASAANRSIAITLGTGLGAAFMDRGIPVVSGQEVPPMGSMWHLPFHDATAEDSFSTRWFIKRYAQKTGNSLEGVKQLVDRAATESSAKEVFSEFGCNLGEFLSPWVKKFTADMVVMGGNISAAYPLFGPDLEKTMSQHPASAAIVVSELKEEAAAIGSARLFEANFWSQIQELIKKM